ncbi:hypothetical protein BOTBODRAFT_176615 [Botryobasidium botryosum FD-172 SS1]|uniref:Uncharacterized protein n=1 Tax=Botryobasidium botryosum (strain FD-172 SS1) TaxID=930990 RepID=A0A067MBK7_BOTB1|nr:hypothetical protein BOTBODRAFT_176615 [Botryobasidium botryosum FD-172 SS1]
MGATPPAHSHNSSDGKSFLTILTDPFNNSVIEMVNDAKTTADYVNKAKKYIAAVPLGATIPPYDIPAKRILESMLKHAGICGGGRGTRYVACAIVNCKESVYDRVTLAADWLRFFLLPFKGAYNHTSALSSANSTPDLEQIIDMIDPPDGSRPPFKRDALKRQNGRPRNVRSFR